MDASTLTQEQWRDTIGIELWRIPVVILSAIIIYLVLMLLIRLFGARVLSELTGFDTVVVIMLGSVAGRVIIGHPPTVAAGAIGLVTLVCCEAAFGLIRSNVYLHRAIHAQPTVVWAHGQPQHDLMFKTHLSYEDIMGSIRRAGVAHPQEVRCIILEPNGALSVLQYGVEIDPALLHGVRGADRVLSHDGLGYE